MEKRYVVRYWTVDTHKYTFGVFENPDAAIAGQKQLLSALDKHSVSGVLTDIDSYDFTNYESLTKAQLWDVVHSNGEAWFIILENMVITIQKKHVHLVIEIPDGVLVSYITPIKKAGDLPMEKFEGFYNTDFTGLYNLVQCCKQINFDGYFYVDRDVLAEHNIKLVKKEVEECKEHKLRIEKYITDGTIAVDNGYYAGRLKRINSFIKANECL